MHAIDPAVGAVLTARQASVRQQVDIALIAKSQDAAKHQGRAAVSLLKSAAALGKALGKGGGFDAAG